jgi:hypothetical protein
MKRTITAALLTGALGITGWAAATDHLPTSKPTEATEVAAYDPNGGGSYFRCRWVRGHCQLVRVSSPAKPSPGSGGGTSW